MSIDGHSVHGWDGDKAAHFLRGRSGSSVNVRLARRTSQVPGVAGRPDPPLVYTEYKQVSPLSMAADAVPRAAMCSCSSTGTGIGMFAASHGSSLAGQPEARAAGAEPRLLDSPHA